MRINSLSRERKHVESWNFNHRILMSDSFLWQLLTVSRYVFTLITYVKITILPIMCIYFGNYEEEIKWNDSFGVRLTFIETLLRLIWDIIHEKITSETFDVTSKIRSSRRWKFHYSTKFELLSHENILFYSLAIPWPLVSVNLSLIQL
jgi:hypothetical protein